MSLEERIKQAAENALVKAIEQNGWVFQFKDRLQVPKDFMVEVLSLVDLTSVKVRLARLVEETLADRIMTEIATEMSTDIKQVLSNRERREEIRALARGMVDRMAGK